MSCVLRLRPERPVGHRLRASVIGVGDATVLPGREENTIPKCPVERECGARHCSLRGTNPASITTDTPARSKRVLWTLPSPLNGERIPLKNSRIEPLNRSSRRKEALTSGTDIHQGTKFEPPYVGCYKVHGEGSAESTRFGNAGVPVIFGAGWVRRIEQGRDYARGGSRGGDGIDGRVPFSYGAGFTGRN